MRVCLTAIVYDTDETHKKLSDLLTSTEERKTDFYVIAVDSKSVEGTEAWVKDFIGPERCDVFSFEWQDDFAYARNLTLPHVPKDCDFWYWADSDDTLEGKTFPEVLEDLPDNVNAIGFLYDYERDQFGNNTTTHRRGRLYRNSLKWEWRGAVHEDVYPVDHGAVRPLALKSEDITWVHHTEDRPSSYDRNMRILRKMLEKDPEDARTWYYVGNALFAAKDFPKAAEAYEKYVNISGWDLERYMALVFQAMCYREQNLLEESLAADTRAMHLMPELADAYFGIGETYTRMGQWKKGLHFGELGMKAVMEGGIPDADMFINLNAYAFKPYMWMADCYLKLGMNDRALDCLETAAKQRPEEDLLKGITHVKSAMRRRSAMEKILWVAGYLRDSNEPLKAWELLKITPAGGQEDSRIGTAKRMLYREIGYMFDPTAYANHYFEAEEFVDPVPLLDTVAVDFPRIEWVLQKLKQAGAKKVLEIGVGNAITTLYYAKQGIQVVAIDIDRRRVKNANFNAVRAGLLTTKELDFGEGEDDEMRVTVPDITPDSIFQVHWSKFEDIQQSVLDLGPFDAVLATEIIEHLLVPEELLNVLDGLAPRVIITTPDGAYEGPQPVNGHVRGYSLKELAAEVLPHGTLVDLHPVKNPAGEYDNLQLQYLPGQKMSQDAAIIWCFDTGQKWTPDSIKSGIGGSETAVIRVAEELAKRGMRVTVYAECEGVWNGVRYALSKDFRPQPCKLFVSWRSLGPIPHMADFAEKRMIWAHDVHFGEVTPEQLRGVTILALSDWHKKFMEGLWAVEGGAIPVERFINTNIVVTGNGIDPERFTKKVERIPHRIIYAHSPDRGLDRVLKLFPKIREVYPDATLEVFYGFDMARQRNPKFVALIEALAKQPGVTLHGRVGQYQLAEEYQKADALIYPSVMPNGQAFDETYCIGVVEAQAAGCFPITASHGALRETNRGGGFAKLETFDHDALFQLFAFWKRPLKEQNNIRRYGYADKLKVGEDYGGQLWALEQGWGHIADQWMSLLQEAPVEAAAE